MASTGYLSSETTAISQAESTFDQISMTPKTLATMSKFSSNMSFWIFNRITCLLDRVSSE